MKQIFLDDLSVQMIPVCCFYAIFEKSEKVE